MAHYLDLTPYTYFEADPWDAILKAYPNPLNVGWLQQEQPYRTSGEPLTEADLDKLFAHCLNRVNLCKGIHICDLCIRPDTSDLYELYTRYIPPAHGSLDRRREDDTAYLNNGEALIIGSDGQAFLAPIMVYHYVMVHGYRPPQVFMDALRVSDPEQGRRLDRQTYAHLGPDGLRAFDDACARWDALWGRTPDVGGGN
jgi:hypothetical protein